MYNCNLQRWIEIEKYSGYKYEVEDKVFCKKYLLHTRCCLIKENLKYIQLNVTLKQIQVHGYINMVRLLFGR